MMNIFELSDQVVDDLVDLEPEQGTFLGLADSDGRWSDTSPAGFAKRQTFWRATIEAAASCETPSRSHEVAKAVLISGAEIKLDSIDAQFYLVDLNNIASPWQSISEVFGVMPDDTPQAWANIVSRLSTIDQPLAGYQQCLASGLHAGRAVAHRQVAAAIEQGRAASGPTSGFQLLISRLERASQTNDSLNNPQLRADLGEAVSTAKVAYGSMTDWLESEYLPLAVEADAVGRERYVQAAQQFLGETIDPEALYEWGWSEIASLTERLNVLTSSIDPDSSVHDVMDLLATDPDRGAPNIESFLATMTERQLAALETLDGVHFDIPPPVKRVEVKEAPPGGALAPYYTPPSEDFTRPGTVWYPTGDQTFFPLYEEVSTAYHEGFPGHHLQIGWQTAMSDELSRFHRSLTWYSGSGEGWALYAETLMGELGFLEKPDYEVGLVTSQLFRACRVVIDIGTHCEFEIPGDQSFHPNERWSFDTATALLREVAFIPSDIADSEATRYFGWPGQAISYKVGEKALLDLRAEMSSQPDFDLKQFHAKVLSVGSIGLDLLRDLVRSA